MTKYLSIAFIVLTACNNEDQSSKKDIISCSYPSAKTVSGCYMQTIQRDTIIANLFQQGNDITGTLVFDNYEKDGSKGNVTGKRYGDTLKLLYTFQSEGITSVMDIYFKLQNNNLLRGIGEMNTKADTAYFINPSAVTFPVSGTLSKVDCGIIQQ